LFEFPWPSVVDILTALGFFVFANCREQIELENDEILMTND